MSILVLLATAVAAAVEWVEALTIVLAVGLFKGWKAAFVGLALGLLALVALVAVFGVTITSHVSIEAARTLVGVFLLLFGLKWLHKAILRSSGLKSLHDEAKTFEETKEMLVASGTSRAGAGLKMVRTPAWCSVMVNGPVPLACSAAKLACWPACGCGDAELLASAHFFDRMYQVSHS